MEMVLDDGEDEQQQQQTKRIKTPHPSESEDPLSVPTLLPEIFVEILLKLPVESLLRCKAVCKSWLSLISDPSFIKSHLILSTSNNHYARHRLIFRTLRNPSFRSCPIYDVGNDKNVNVVELEDLYDNDCWIFGSCNGLLLTCTKQDTLFICNPSTRKLNWLPNRGFKVRRWNMRSGFGYDGSTDDYKVVGICVSKQGDKYDTEVMIYSLKNGKWRKIGEFFHGIPTCDYGRFFKGAVHWLAGPDYNSTYSRTIVSLDLANETYDELLLPVSDDGDKDFTLGVLGEWLCVLCHCENRADLWVMKFYGVKDSWTKLVSIPYLMQPNEEYMEPLCILNDGKVLLRFQWKLVICDYKNGSSSKPEVQNFDEYSDASVVVESLVSPFAL